MRHDHTDDGQSATSRSNGWNTELQRAETEDGARELRDRELRDRELRDRDGEIDVRTADDRDVRAADDRDLAAGRLDGVAAGSWQDIKSRFVDDPTGALVAAEALLRTAVEDKVRALTSEAEALCARDHDEDESSTETLRTRMLRYQAYCERLARMTEH